MYVGATRARYSLAFVQDGAVTILDVQVYE